jgi:hypothetical protein
MKIRVKTKEEFKKDGLWDEGYNVPFRWNFQGKMDYLLGKTLEIEDDWLDSPRLQIGEWVLRKDDYIILEENKMTVEEKIKKLKKELAELEVECNTKYPIYKRSKEYGHIVKFFGLQKGEVVYSGGSYQRLGCKLDSWKPHTDTYYWEDVAYDKERDLFDKQLVWCWDDTGFYQRILRFYDAKNECSYDSSGYRDGAEWDNYESYKGEYPKWALEAYKTLRN